MKKLLVLALFFTTLGTVQAEVIRAEGMTLYKLGDECRSIRIDLVAGAIQDVPYGTYTDLEYVLLLSSKLDTMFPDLTAAELLECNGTVNVITLPTWKVAKRTNSITRPYYLVNEDGIKATVKSGDIIIGAACAGTFAPSTGGKEYRYLVKYPKMVSLCELR